MTTDVWELFDLKGEVAIVTGGPGTLGSQMCDALAEAGAHVVVASRTYEECEAKADALSREHAESIPVEVDVTDPEAVEGMIRTTVDRFGTVDVLVNNAYSGDFARFEDMTVDEWRSALDGALTSTFLCSQAVYKPMRSEDGGSIVNLGSIYGIVSPDHRIYGRANNFSPPNYGPAKAGVIQLTRWLATYLASDGIRVNCLSPGGFYNDERASEDPHYEADFAQAYRERTPMGRMGDSTDLKGPIVYLASAASKWMTGQNMVVDGGWTAL